MINNKTIRQVVINSKLFPCSGITYNEVTGSICNFETDLVMPLDSCVASFLPVQASGIPTPSSPLPITGHTGLNITRAGKNLANIKAYSQWEIISSTYSMQRKLFAPARVIMSLVDNDPTVDLTGVSLGFVADDYTGGALNTNQFRWVINSGAIAENRTNVPISGNTSIYLNSLIAYPRNEATYNKIFARYKIQIEVGETATTFEAYKGTTYPVSWTSHGTIYGGNVDIKSGIITKTWNKANIAAADIVTVSPVGSTSIVVINGPSDMSASGLILSTDYEYATGIEDGGISIQEGKIRIIDSRCTDKEAAQSLLDGLEIVYEMSVPTTTSITAETVETLEGINNIWNDAGETTVKYAVSGGSCNGIMKFLPIFYPNGKGVNRSGSTF